LMGHSVGEYVAAVLAGVLALEDGLRLLARRARLMQSLPKGAMAAVFADESAFSALLRRYCNQLSVAAINGPRQTVISGEVHAVNTVLAALKQAGIESRLLTVSHAFHSPMIEPMLDSFEKFAQSIHYSAPRTELISNVTGKPWSMGSVPNARYWRDHARQPVLFADSVRSLEHAGCDVVLEIGPSATLVGMARPILAQGRDSTVLLPSLRLGQEDWSTLLQSLGRLHLQGAIIDWYGFDRDYSRSRVSLPTYPYERSRYWLEPDEKNGGAPPVNVDVPRSDAASSTSPGSQLYRMQWQQLPSLRKEPAPPSGTWLILQDRTGVADALTDRLRKRQDRVLLLKPGRAFAELGRDMFTVDPKSSDQFLRVIKRALDGSPSITGTIHLWNYQEHVREVRSSRDLTRGLTLGHRSLFALAQAMVQANAYRDSRLLVVTNHAQRLDGDFEFAVEKATLLGLALTLPMELKGIVSRSVDLESLPAESAAELLHGELADLWQSPKIGDVEIVHRRGKRYSRTIVPVDSPINATKTPWVKNGVYLITGGLGGIGERLAQHLATNYAAHLILTGRTKLPSMLQQLETHDSPSSEGDLVGRKILALEKLLKVGAGSVEYVSGSVDDDEHLEHLRALIDTQYGRLDGVLHAAGTIDTKHLSFRTKSPSGFEQTLAPKVLGSWRLWKSLQSLQPARFVVFSSIGTLSPALGAGECDYATACRFQNHFAAWLRVHGCPARSAAFGVGFHRHAGSFIGWSDRSASGVSAVFEEKERSLTLNEHSPSIPIT
ncbi:MAG: KR domain-containing protein, partial [Planctomycetota bacterium]